MNDPNERSPFGLTPGKQPKNPWWAFNPALSFDPDEALVPVALNRYFDQRTTTHFIYFSSLSGCDKIEKLCTERFGTPAVIRHQENDNVGMMLVWIWDNGMLRLVPRTSGTVEMASVSLEDIKWTQETLRPFTAEIRSKSSLYMASRKGASAPVSFRRMGTIEAPLERGNYPYEVLQGYDRAVADLKAPKPNGRILLMEGPPGSGKTHLIKGLIQDVRAAYIVVNPKNYEDLMDPEFMHGIHESFLDQGEAMTLVFVLEDADKLLQPRQMGASLGGLSSALNMGDGLLSEMMDIRIIATTNAPIETIDPALTRPGRLSECIHIGALQPSQATDILRRLVPKVKGRDARFGSSPMLAEVYARAKKLGWGPPPPKEKGEPDIAQRPRKFRILQPSR